MPDREERQDLSKYLKAGSDVPPRGKGVRDVDTGKRGKARRDEDPPKGYKGEHRRK